MERCTLACISCTSAESSPVEDSAMPEKYPSSGYSSIIVERLSSKAAMIEPLVRRSA